MRKYILLVVANMVLLALVPAFSRTETKREFSADKIYLVVKRGGESEQVARELMERNRSLGQPTGLFDADQEQTKLALREHLTGVVEVPDTSFFEVEKGIVLMPMNKQGKGADGKDIWVLHGTPWLIKPCPPAANLAKAGK